MLVLFNKNNIAYLHSQYNYHLTYIRYRRYGFPILIASNIQNFVLSVTSSKSIITNLQPRSQGFSLFVTGKAGKGPGTGRSHDFQHPDIVGVINYNNNE
jgi:hypothetical protein